MAVYRSQITVYRSQKTVYQRFSVFMIFFSNFLNFKRILEKPGGLLKPHPDGFSKPTVYHRFLAVL
jgi:hypothetical protein